MWNRPVRMSNPVLDVARPLPAGSRVACRVPRAGHHGGPGSQCHDTQVRRRPPLVLETVQVTGPSRRAPYHVSRSGVFASGECNEPKPRDGGQKVFAWWKSEFKFSRGENDVRRDQTAAGREREMHGGILRRMELQSSWGPAYSWSWWALWMRGLVRAYCTKEEQGNLIRAVS